jgi:hypothetical protein
MKDKEYVPPYAKARKGIYEWLQHLIDRMRTSAPDQEVRRPMKLILAQCAVTTGMSHRFIKDCLNDLMQLQTDVRVIGDDLVIFPATLPVSKAEIQAEGDSK